MTEMGVSDNCKGLVLAMSSSAFIGSSFILKKKGLKRAAARGTRAGVGGYTYLLEPLWWAGMVTMIIGEIANFVAYIYAPAVLVTPLGALSIIVSAVLSHFLLKERLPKMGVLGCVSCIVGSIVIVIHAPLEQTPSSVQEIWDLATQPAFLIYVIATVSGVLVLIIHFEPRYGQNNMLVYLGICSLVGSLTVVSIKAIGIAIKLTLDGISQIAYPQTWFFLSVATICVITQLNYLNRALDTFNATIVSPVYYVMFTTLTIIASAIMFKDWSGQDISSITSEICGFITVLSGTIILHMTREQEESNMQSTYIITYSFLNLPNKVREVLKLDQEMKDLAKLLIAEQSLLVFGRGYNYATALEGALKVKEVALMHSEGILAGEMKHGPLALVDENLPIVVVATRDACFSKQQSVIQQLHARRGRLIVMCSKGDASSVCPNQSCRVIEVPQVEDCLQPVINVVPLQLLAYHLTVLRGFNVDQPRNLAKSVTTQ